MSWWNEEEKQEIVEKLNNIISECGLPPIDFKWVDIKGGFGIRTASFNVIYSKKYWDSITPKIDVINRNKIIENIEIKIKEYFGDRAYKG
jgi:RecA-family ATPase